jgi:hypothetical protein
VPRLPVALALVIAVPVGCSAGSPASDEATAEALGSGPPQILVPVAGTEKAIAAACAPELEATYCSDTAARAATDRCVAKLGADVVRSCGGACLAPYSPVRAGAACRAGKTYATAAACDAPVADDCSFYRACLESGAPCGDDGYALDFGERLCYAFVADRAHYTSRGQAWLRRVRTCLQTSIAPMLHEGLACGALEDAAYAAHAHCYTQSGDSICHLPVRDVAEIVRVLGTTLLSSRGLAQIKEVAAACLLEGAFFEGLARAADDEATLRVFLDETTRAPR